MAAIFQIRRDSGSVSLVDGELYINKGPDSLQYGVNERAITVTKLDELNSGSLYLSGGISASGDITASNIFVSGNLHISGNLILGNSGSDTITATGEFTSHIIPNPNKAWDIGSTNKIWANAYIDRISGSAFTGSVYGMGDPTSFSTSVDSRLDLLELSSSLYDNAMSASLRLYVSPSGSDSNDGSDPAHPFRTIKAAVESLGAVEYTNTKRYTIYVGSGNYTEQNPIVVPPGVAIVGDTLRTVRLTAANPTKDFFHVHDSNYFYGLRFLDLKYPSFAFSFPCSTATATISGGGVSGLTMIHTAAGYQDGETVNVIIEGPDASGSAATATATVSGGSLTINMVSNGSGYIVGEKPHVSIQAPTSKRPVITTSPYIQNCSSITGPFNTSGTKVLEALPYNVTTLQIDEQGAGGGIRIDGNLVHPLSPLESFVADAFTQVNQGGPGHLVINKGYAQFVSCFTTFCTYGFKVGNGGFANISNSVIDFGAKGLVSKTYFPQTYNTGSSLQTLTSTVVGAVIAQDGAGYTGSVAGVTISGGGASVQATAEATVNANGSIDEIVILTPGSGYTSQPTVTIAAPTGPGAIQATTVAGKAEISGIASILIQLESGSRGVDVSSNMILSGTDYLVTNVATGSNSSQRYVSVYPSPPSVTTGDNIYFHQLSNISTGGLVMEYVGSGVTYNALPKYGGVPNRNREIIEYAPGRVFYSTVDNIGNLKIGDFFAVNQLTGEVTIDANKFNLSGLSAIGPFKRNGVGVGVVLNEVSNNTTLLNAQGVTGEDTVPTQYAVKTYIDTISGSVDSRLDDLEWTGSNHEGRLDNIESYTSSLKQAINVDGGNTTILGNLIVEGTTTNINTQNLYVEDKVITLASGSIDSLGSDGAGFEVAGANVSMSWEHANSRFGLNSNLALYGQLSSSTIAGLNNASVQNYSTSVDSRLSNLQITSASINQHTSSINRHSESLNLFTASEESKNVIISAYTASMNSFTSSIHSYTASINGHILDLNSWTGSQNEKDVIISNITASYNGFTGSATASIVELFATASNHEDRIDVLETKVTTLGTYTASIDDKFVILSNITASYNSHTASLNTFTSSTFVTFSQSVDSRLDAVEYTVTTLDPGNVGAALVAINLATASLQNFSASTLLDLDNLHLYTASTNARLNRIEESTASLNSFSASNGNTSLNAYTSSLNNAIQLTGSTVSFLGNIVVYGTQSVINSQNVEISDNILYLSPTASIDNDLGVVGHYNDGTYRHAGIFMDASDGHSWKVFNGLQDETLGTVNTSGTGFTLADFKAGAITGTSFTGQILATNGVISGSSQLIATLPSGVVSGSSQVTGIGNAQLTNSTISGVSLGSNLYTLTIGSGLSGTSYNGSGAVTITNTGVISITTSSGLSTNTNAAGNVSITNTGVTSITAGTGIGISGGTGGVTISIGQEVATTSNVRFGSIGVGTNASGVSGEIRATGDITAFFSSDIRLKENIQPIQNALTKVKSISGNTYDWKEGYEEIHSHKGNDVGVIAQEIEQILPEAVIDRETGYKAVNYEKIIPLLIEAIKELSDKVKELESK